jgi:high-affinity iron transporter
MAVYLLSLREGLEAVLLISMLLSALRRLERNDLVRWVWLGVGSALAVSLAVGVVLTVAGIEFQGRGEQVFEGSVFLLAAGVLTGMLFWMRGQGAQLHGRLTAEVRRATEAVPDGVAGQADGSPGSTVPPPAATARNRGLSLFAVSFLALVREGLELALLVTATAFGSSLMAAAVGTLLGLTSAAGLGLLLFLGAVRLNLKRFFQIANVVLILFAGGMVALGIHEFVEAGLVPGLLNPIWNLNPVLSDQSTVGGLLRSLLGYSSNPALTEVLVYVGYLALASWALWCRRKPAAMRAL